MANKDPEALFDLDANNSVLPSANAAALSCAVTALPLPPPAPMPLCCRCHCHHCCAATAALPPLPALQLQLRLQRCRRFRRWAAIYFCLPSPSAVLSLFTECWLLHSPPAQQHADHITKLKTFPFPTSWTYFDLLRVSTYLVCCVFFERMKNMRGCKIGSKHSPFFLVFVCDYLI